jgi:DNA-binding transcriptional ArsR family regulator
MPKRRQHTSTPAATPPRVETAAAAPIDPKRPSILHLDATAVKVLAHPLRSRLLAALRTGGPATATDLATRLSTNTGATSYHLRKLASVGLVEETGDGRGRERPWRATTEMHGFTQRDVAYDPDGAAAADWLRRYYLRAFVDRYESWLEDHASWPLDWEEVADGSDFPLRLSPTRAAALQRDLVELAGRYRDPDPNDPNATTVELDIHLFPIVKAPR